MRQPYREEGVTQWGRFTRFKGSPRREREDAKTAFLDSITFSVVGRFASKVPLQSGSKSQLQKGSSRWELTKGIKGNFSAQRIVIGGTRNNGRRRA